MRVGASPGQGKRRTGKAARPSWQTSCQEGRRVRSGLAAGAVRRQQTPARLARWVQARPTVPGQAVAPLALRSGARPEVGGRAVLP